MNASIIIVNWNGAELLRRGLPSVIEAVAYSGSEHEIIVVDDASQDDSVAVLRKEFPSVKLVELPSNQGFGVACNKGVEESKNPVVILLNTDMIVEADFLDPLLAPFSDGDVFAVACKIMRSDKKTIEVGRTVGSFSCGFIKVNRSKDEGYVEETPLTTLTASGGASAFCREKYLELGGFDHLYYPFYWEDSDLSYGAWKRGWKVLYQPKSIVYHEHQGTIGKSFSKSYVKTMYYKNKLLFTWKNITDNWYMTQHLIILLPYLLLTLLVGKTYYIKGFIKALQETSLVMEKRRQQIHKQHCTDRQVLQEKCTYSSID